MVDVINDEFDGFERRSKFFRELEQGLRRICSPRPVNLEVMR
jgi:hypothetical protein